MNLDYSKLSDDELEAIANNDYSKLSEDTLQAIAQQPAAPAQKPAGPTEAPEITFAAKFVNSLGFGAPEYLEKTFQPERYQQSQAAMATNPQAARYGEMAGDIASYAIPGVAGALKGAQLGGQAVNALARRFAPSMAEGTGAQLAGLFGRAQGAATGGTMGAQLGAAVPGLVQGSPEKAVAASSLVNQAASQIPFTSPLGGITGNIVPAAVGLGGETIKQGRLGQVAPYLSPLGPVAEFGKKTVQAGVSQLDEMIRAAAARRALMMGQQGQ